MAQNPQQRTQGGRGGGGQPSRHLTLDLSAPLPDGDLHKVVASAWYKEDNRPKKGVAILFYLDLADLRHPVPTNEEGQAVATLAELGPGPHTITVKVQGWGSAVSKTVTIEEKKKVTKRNVSKIKIHATRLKRGARGTNYRILIELVDKDGNGIPGLRVRVSDPRSKDGFALTEPTEEDGSVVVKTVVNVPAYRFTAAADGTHCSELLFDFQPHVSNPALARRR